MNFKDEILKLKLYHCAILGFFLAFFYYYNFFDHGVGIDAEINTVVTQTKAKEKTLERLREAIKNKEKFQKEIDLISGGLKEFLDYFPSDLNHTIVQDRINEGVRFAGAKMVSMKPIETKREYTHYREVAFDVVTEGNFHQLMSFLARITQIKNVVNLKEVSFDSGRSKEATPKISMKTKLIVYSYSQEGASKK